MSRPLNIFLTLPQPKNNPFWPQKLPKNRVNIKVSIKGTIENNSYSAIEIDRITVFELYPNPKNTPFGPKKIKTGPIQGKNLRLELKRT